MRAIYCEINLINLASYVKEKANIKHLTLVLFSKCYSVKSYS